MITLDQLAQLQCRIVLCDGVPIKFQNEFAISITRSHKQHGDEISLERIWELRNERNQTIKLLKTYPLEPAKSGGFRAMDMMDRFHHIRIENVETITDIQKLMLDAALGVKPARHPFDLWDKGIELP